MRALSFLLIPILTSILLTTTASATNPFSVSGNVTDAEGTPIPNAEVLLLDADNLPLLMTYADANGSFVFENMSFDTPQISVMASFVKPAIKDQRWGQHSSLHEAIGHVIIPDNETRFHDYIIPKTGFVHGYIVRESDQILLTGTVSLSNGDVCVVTNPLDQYRFEVPPGNYSVFVVHDEDGKRFVSDKIDVQVIPASNIYEVPGVDLMVRTSTVVNIGALTAALLLGLMGILSMHFVLRR